LSYACIASQPTTCHEDVMRSERKNSRTRTKSGTGRSKAKNKTRRSPSKVLAARAAEHFKKQSVKPHDQRPRSAANQSAGHDLNAIPNSASSPLVTLKGKQADIAALPAQAAANGSSNLRSANAGLMSFSPLAMLLRQQGLLASMMLNVMQTQQHWARAFCGLPWRTA
jgi:hypothetical protein